MKKNNPKKIYQLMLIVFTCCLLILGCTANAATSKSVRIENGPDSTSYSFVKNGEEKIKIVVTDSSVTTEKGYLISESPLSRDEFSNGFDKKGNFYTISYTGELIEYTLNESGENVKYSLQLEGETPKFFWDDDEGFLESVVTQKKVYPISAFKKTEIGYDDLQYGSDSESCYVVNQTKKASLWVGGSKLHTLKLKKATLYLDGQKVANGVKKFFFINQKKFGFVKKNGKYYTVKLATPTTKKLIKKASSATINDAGFATIIKK